MLVEVRGNAVPPAEVILVDRLGIVVQGPVVIANTEFFAGERRCADLFGDFHDGGAGIGPAQGLVVNIAVDVPLRGRKTPHLVPSPGGPVVRGEDHVRAARIGYQQVVDDLAPVIIITTPIFLPIMTGIGMDPVQFGIMLILNLGLGLVTPPVGSVLFVGCAIGGIRIEDTFRSIWPFYLAFLAVLALVTYLPGTTLLLPSYFR